MCGILSVPNNDEITLKVKSGATILASTGLISFASATSNVWNLDITFVVRALGVAGVAQLQTHFVFSYEENSADKFISKGVDILNNTVFDTTVINILDITATWNQTSLSDSIYSTTFNLNKVF
jgi:hypothetical protein